MAAKQDSKPPASSHTTTMERLGTLLMVAAGLVLCIIYTLGAAVLALVPRRFKRHDITGKVALVTGGGKGIGQLIIIGLAQRGAKVITWDVNAAGNAETVKKVKKAGYDCLAYTVDVSDRQAIYQAAEQLIKKGLKVDILVNNAGIVTGRDLLDCPDELVERTFKVNILSHFWTTKVFLPAMIKSNSGHVVTVASMAGKLGCNKLIDYCSSKFAAVGFDESLRSELLVNKHDGVYTTVICPCFISTGMFEGVKSNLIPIMEPQFVADEVVDGILMRCKEVVLPFYANIFALNNMILAFSCQKFLLRVTGIDVAMNGFLGRSGAAGKHK